ncbi:MAG: cation diffusion facilitator family transporter [Alphaproteobacteria bacterium]|nr:cation diffusion facilitator family transporter [Alphaproteobacteria bacterium]
MSPEAAARVARRAAQISVAAAAFLILLKTWAWLASGSVAILAALADSTLDLAASLFTYFAVRLAATPPDRNHRFGHGKAEAFAGLFQAGLVMVSAALILVEALQRLINPQPLEAAPQALAVMGISMLVSIGVVMAQSRAIAATGSLAVRGDRAHYLSDLAANGAVIIGILGAAYAGLAWADTAAAVFVTVWLALGAWDIARAAADHLMDREAPESLRTHVRELTLAEQGLRGVHDLRTRLSGPYVHVQFHADLDPDMSLEAAHRIIVAAEQRIRAEYPNADVIIHPDPRGRAEPHGLPAFGERRDDRGGAPDAPQHEK